MSAILSSDDLNDFISPGVACIKPVEVKKSQDQAEIEIKSGEAYEVGKDGEKKALEEAQISLSDCLACSGCITSAESVLVSMQSHNEVLTAVRSEDAKNKVFVASISHQVRASLAASYGITITEADARLKHVLVDLLGFKYVVGTEVGRAISLEYGAREAMSKIGNGQGPILSSSCPGWTCYVEKTHPHVIDYLSKVKSPQQITGSLIKHIISQEHGIGQGNVYHVSIMPCFDKKLEAARPEFGVDEVRDVDCVITAKEVVQMLLDEGLDFASLPTNYGEYVPSNWPQKYHWASNEGSSSGGYLHYVLKEFQRQQDFPTHIDIRPGRNSDIVEYVVVRDSDEEELYRGGQVYGFRNIQNLVRKLKMASSRGGKGKVRGPSRRPGSERGSDVTSWGYVEVQACPGGCINGGGLIGRPSEVSDKEWRDNVEKLYRTMDTIQPQGSSIDQWALGLWQSDPSGLITTEFKAVAEADTAPAAVSIGTKW
uniref:Cytosolic Fe-S cluster assembly factor NAR1 n=1 Tax=Blastobotrys adeninivorans TaxID=409370 RepID=A0A060TDQ3_BLAAD